MSGEDCLLREVMDADLPVFFEQQRDLEANWMAAFTAKDPANRESFLKHWDRILSDPMVNIRTIVMNDNRVAGHVLSYEDEGRTEVSYWIGKDFWGRGIATWALREFLRDVVGVRPVHARVAKDNARSLQVLEKCGFTRMSEDTGFANARGEEIEEWVVVLKGE